MRKIKLILRQANLNYIELKRAGFEPNRLICIAATASKYVMQDAKTETTYFDYITKHKRIPANNELNRIIFITNPRFRSYTNEHITKVGSNPKELGHTADITLVRRVDPRNVQNYPSTPYVVDSWHSDDERNKICLPDFYFSDL